MFNRLLICYRLNKGLLLRALVQILSIHIFLLFYYILIWLIKHLIITCLIITCLIRIRSANVNDF